MANKKIKTDLRTIFEVTVGGNLVQFRINDKSGTDAEVSFNGDPWIPADVVYHAVKAFEDRFPEAFDDDDEGNDSNGPAPALDPEEDDE